MNYLNPFTYLWFILAIIFLVLMYQFWGLTHSEIIAQESIVAVWNNMRYWSYFFGFFLFIIFLTPIFLTSDGSQMKEKFFRFFLFLISYIVLINMSYYFSLQIYLAFRYFI